MTHPKDITIAIETAPSKVAAAFLKEEVKGDECLYELPNDIFLASSHPVTDEQRFKAIESCGNPMNDHDQQDHCSCKLDFLLDRHIPMNIKLEVLEQLRTIECAIERLKELHEEEPNLNNLQQDPMAQFFPGFPHADRGTLNNTITLNDPKSIQDTIEQYEHRLKL